MEKELVLDVILNECSSVISILMHIGREISFPYLKPMIYNQSMELNGKKVLVTGSSSGIGQAIAIECAKKGAIVIIHFRKNESGAKETLKEIEKYSKGLILQADLTNDTEVKNLFQEIKKSENQLDMLVNNAGEAMAGTFDDIDMWKIQWENIFMSQVYTSNEFLKLDQGKHLRKIVNISSVYGFSEMGNQDFPQYSAAKAAVNSFTYNLAKKAAPDVLVNAVAPGYTLTPPWEGVPKDELSDCESLTKIKRFIQPKEIAGIVVALLENNAITGEIIRVDGGLHLWDIK